MTVFVEQQNIIKMMHDCFILKKELRLNINKNDQLHNIFFPVDRK